MSILDDAIREHLELKRAHGADEGEVQRLEDEAFGPPQRPDEIDPFAEAPTEFLASPGETPADAPVIGDEHERSGRRPNITDLQEAPPADAEETGEGPAAAAPPPSPADAAAAPPPPPVDEVPADLAPPAEEEHPAGEHEIVPDAGPGTEERHAIADQPTQMFDVQAQMDAEAVEAPAPVERESPSDEELVDAAQGEPQAAPPAPEEPVDGPPTELHEQPPLESRGPDAEVAGHPPAEAEPEGAVPEEESAEFDFFNEQRLSDELDQALEAPLPPTDEHIAMPQYGDAPAQGGIFDFEADEEPYEDDPSQEVLRRADDAEAAEEPAEELSSEVTEEAPRPAPEAPSEEAPPESPEAPSEEAPRPAPEAPSEEAPRDSAEPASEENAYDYDPDTGHEDVLEDTPRFLEDAPEDDDLWFEQKPPKDFDLD
ncbi:MAG TPA: hypothetical protein VGI17_11940 [Solirubrobacterales bacterium]